tara:strand:+ start:1111 stop:1389 length:279 start_codon:yes stop_codon:yes gene_type:complete
VTRSITRFVNTTTRSLKETYSPSSDRDPVVLDINLPQFFFDHHWNPVAGYLLDVAHKNFLTGTFGIRCFGGNDQQAVLLSVLYENQFALCSS